MPRARNELVNIILTGLLVANIRASGEPPKKTSAACASVAGTYSDLHYNAEGGDLLGTEISIAVSAKGDCLATVRIAEGELESALVSPVVVDKERLGFTVRDGDEVDHYEGRITGTRFSGLVTIVRDNQTFKTLLRLPRAMSDRRKGASR